MTPPTKFRGKNLKTSPTRCALKFEFGQLQCERGEGHTGPHMARFASDRICFNDQGTRVEGGSAEDYE